jgi:hypothetical protein
VSDVRFSPERCLRCGTAGFVLIVAEPFERDAAIVKSELMALEEAEVAAKSKEPRELAIDWTESEWFAVWLRLARGEYEPQAEAVAAS